MVAVLNFEASTSSMAIVRRNASAALQGRMARKFPMWDRYESAGVVPARAALQLRPRLEAIVSSSTRTTPGQQLQCVLVINLLQNRIRKR